MENIETKKKIKLDSTIGLGIFSEEATVEIHEKEDDVDLVSIDFSTAIGKISLIISLTNLEKILEAAKHLRD